MARNTSKGPGRRQATPAESAETESSSDVVTAGVLRRAVKQGTGPLNPRRNGGWREIEALREKAALKASLADVWDEDFDLDDEILAELDHTAEFFTSQEEEPEDEIFDDDDEVGEYFDDDEV